MTRSDKIHGLPTRWRGLTIFQINAGTRKELGMVSSSANGNLRPLPARKVAQHERDKQRNTRPRLTVREENVHGGAQGVS